MGTKLHELLAAEKTPNAAWNQTHADTLKKFGNPSHFFDGHTKVLKMIEDSPQNAAIEAQAREEKPVTTTVFDTLDYALDLYANAEDLQYQKNATNRIATSTVYFEGQPLLTDMPVDELLGLESRLGNIRKLFEAMPTLDATRHWSLAPGQNPNVWEVKFPEETTKTEKLMVPVEMSPATDKHPAQVTAVTKDTVVGKFTTTKRSGAITALQKAEAIKRLDMLMVEIKQARMRANETEAVKGKIGALVVNLLMHPLVDPKFKEL